jgi:hypothetical protein
MSRRDDKIEGLSRILYKNRTTGGRNPYPTYDELTVGRRVYWRKLARKSYEYLLEG